MTDDRDTDDHGFDGALGDASNFGDAAHWEAALNGALMGLLFDQSSDRHNDRPSEPHDANANDVLQAAFDALLFGDKAALFATGEAGRVRAWVANDDAAPNGFGRIMFARGDDIAAASHLSGALDARSPQITTNLAISSGRAANDNVIWVGSDGDDGFSGVYGRDPSVAVLDNGDALIAWVGTDDAIHAQFLPSNAAGHWDAGDDTERQKLDQLLMNLGDSATQSGGKAGRVAVTATGQNSFAAVWTSEFAVNSILMGTILTLGTAARADGNSEDADASHWTVSDIPPQSLPAGSGAFSVAVSDAGTLTVSFASDSDAASDGSGASHAVVLHLDRDEAADAEQVKIVGSDPDSNITTDGHSTAASHAVHHGDSDGLENNGLPHGNDAGHTSSGGHSGTSIHTTNSETHFGPTIAVADDGHAFVGGFAPDADPEQPNPYYVTPVDAHGKPSGPPIEVTPNAIAIDSDHPTLDVAPTLTGTHDGFAVAWVEKDGSGPATIKDVQVQAFDGHGKPLGSAPVTVATSHGQAASFSDVTTGYTHRDATSTPDHTADQTNVSAAPAAEPPSGLLAVAFVENATTEGFGTLKAQLFSVPDDGAAGGLTALGADGEAGGDNDAVFQMTNEADGLCRDPAIEGLDHGTLAVAWVQQTDHGDGPDVVRGVIMTPGEDVALQELDLTSFMPNGVTDGTDPVLASDAAGDLIIGWIQAALLGGYEAESAVYRRNGHNGWDRPDHSVTIGSFTDIPHDFAIAVTGSGDTLSLVVAWRDGDNNVTTAHFDIGTDQSGPALDVHSSGSDDGLSSGLGLAALPDGQVLLVYGSSDGHDSTITAAVVQLTSGDTTTVVSIETSSGKDVDNSGHNSGPETDANSGSNSGSNSGPENCNSDASALGDNGGPGSSSDDTHAVADIAPLAPVSDAVASPATVVVNYASDLIQFVSNDNVVSPAAVTATDDPAAHETTGHADESCAPTAQDVAALEAMASPNTDNSGSSHSSDGSNSGPGSNYGSGAVTIDDATPAHDLSHNSGHDTSSGGSSASGGSGSGSGGHSVDTASANDNSTPHFGDTALTITTGYGNDVADYITADEQAAMVPEPVSILFEALQFANAFNDAANGDVMLFDDSNVVTISQFKLSDINDPRHDVPLT